MRSLLEPVTTRKAASPVVRRGRRTPVSIDGAAALGLSGYPWIGAMVFVSLGVAARYGLGLAPLAVLIAGLLFAAAAASHAEGVSMYPGGGGASSIVRAAFSGPAAFAAGWVTCLALASAAALSALFAATYLGGFWPEFARTPWDVVAALGILAAVTAAGCSGVGSPLNLRVFAGGVEIALQALLVLMGASMIFRPEVLSRDVRLVNAPSAGHLLLATCLAVTAFAGLETVTDLATAARNPDRDLRRALPATVGAAVALAVALAIVAAMAMPSGVPLTAPALGIAANLPLHVLQTGVRTLLGLMVCGVLVVAAYGSIRQAGRVAASLAAHRELPELLGRRHPRRLTPVAAASGAGLVAAALVLASRGANHGIIIVAGLFAFSMLAVFASVHASVVALRHREPGRHRPFRANTDVAIAGAVCSVVLWAALGVLEPLVAVIALAWLVAGLGVRSASRATRAAVEIADRSGADGAAPALELEYHTMLIPVTTDCDGMPRDTVETAATLAAARGASVVVLILTEVPLGEPFDVEIDDLRERVERIAAQARSIADSYGIRILVTHLRTRDAAESILAEATRRNSEVILLHQSCLHNAPARLATRDQLVRRIVADARRRVMIVQPRAVGA